MRFAGCLILVAVLAAGCSSVQKPSAAVTAVDLTEATAHGSRVAFMVRLENPNEVALPIRETRYTVTLDGERFEFTDLVAATMPPQGDQALTLPAAFTLPEGAVAGRPYRVEGAVVYESPGQIRRALTEAGLPWPSVSFVREGTLGSAN